MTMMKIAELLTIQLDKKNIEEDLDEFITFITQYINDNNEMVSIISLQILSKVLQKISIKKLFNIKKLIPLLVKKFVEKNKEIRLETSQVLKLLMKVISKVFLNNIDFQVEANFRHDYDILALPSLHS